MRQAPLLYPLMLACGLGACGWTDPNNGAEEAAERRERALAQRLKEACSSPATYDRLKQVAFDEAIRIRNADPVNLDLLSTHSSVRVENPVVKSRDETLDVTVCNGRFVLHVPPGAERAFDGKRYIAADIEYAAQAAADGSGLVYQIKGAEPIIYRLAAFDLRTQGHRPLPAPKPTAVAVVTASPSPRPQPIETRPPEATRAPSTPVPQATRAAATASPSFNCRAARSRSERMVCGSERLASLDRAMSSQFYSALSRGDERVRAELRRSRDRFLAYRERCGDRGASSRRTATAWTRFGTSPQGGSSQAKGDFASAAQGAFQSRGDEGYLTASSSRSSSYSSAPMKTVVPTLVAANSLAANAGGKRTQPCEAG